MLGAQNPLPPAVLSRPDVFGDRVVFTAEGDLWIGDVKSLRARRLTTDPGLETNARFSPDGKTLAFTAQYDGGRDVYLLDVDGGSPKRLTYDPAGAEVQGWTPDGSAVLYRSRRDEAERERRLWLVPAKGGMPRLVPIPRAEFGSIAPDGRIAYVPVSNEWANWFRYRAGAADQIWITDGKGGGFRKLTKFDGVNTTPVWCGRAIYFVSEATGTLNLARLDPDSGAVTPVTKTTENAVRYPSSDGKRVVFQAGPSLALFNPSDASVKPLPFDLDGDLLRRRPQRVRLAGATTQPAIGPTGKRIAYSVRGQLVTVAPGGGELRVVENAPGARAMLPAWSPDGKTIAFVSDRTGENEVWTVPAAGGGPARQVTKGLAANPYSLVWSPDGKSVAISDREARVRIVDAATGGITEVLRSPFAGSYDSAYAETVWSADSRLLAISWPSGNFDLSVSVFDAKTKKLQRVSTPGINSFSPAFSPDGRYLAYLAERSVRPFNPNLGRQLAYDETMRVTLVTLDPDAASPFLPKTEDEGATPEEPKKDAPKPEPDLAGAPARIIEPPIRPGRYTKLFWTEGRMILNEATSPAPAGEAPEGYAVLAFDLGPKKLVELSDDAQIVTLSADGKRLLLSQGGSDATLDAGADPGTDPKRVDLGTAAVEVDPVAEWRQIFAESWRVGRDFFYDPGHHGVDWNAVRAKYEPRLSGVASRSDLSALLKDMVSELRSGHAYISDPTPPRRSEPYAYLGADFEPATLGVRIKRLLKGDDFDLGVRSPLLTPGVRVKEGDYLLAINGRRIEADQDPQALLIGLDSQTVALTVNDKPALEGARVIRVKPLASEAELRLQDFVNGRRAYVKRVGGENFGYLYARDMVGGGATDFTKGRQIARDSDAVVCDFRGNGGGYVSSILLNSLLLKPIQWWQPRVGGTWSREDWAPVGHLAALCDERNFSDGELVIEAWKKLKLGPVVGKRTGGGEVGSGGGYALSDGGLIYVPNYAGFDEKGWLIEGVGATPDVEVDQDPAAVLAGRDPQLDKAIALLKARLAKEPIRRPNHPPFPKKD